MEQTVYVIGHRNPDTDSVASAIAYANLRQRQGAGNIVAAMAGAPNPHTRFVLKKLAIPDPLYLADVHPKVRDTLRRESVTLCVGSTAYEALEKFHQSGVRTLPILDETARPQGMVSLLKLSETLLLPCPERQREIFTSLAALARTLGGRFITGAEDDAPVTLNLFIGAMREDCFAERIEGWQADQLLIVTGNRREIQQAAIERQVRVLVITGDHPVDPDILAAAREVGVNIIVTPHDTATAAWLARLSTPAVFLADRKFSTIGIGESLSHLRQKLLGSGESAILALEDDGTLAGVATKSSLFGPLPYGLILVDHNELGQAVPGADEVEILEVIDHHKLGNKHSVSPIAFYTSPVGSTCTLVARRYRDSGIEPEETIASLLLAGPLLARCGAVDLPLAGGDFIGRRRVDTHILAFRELGAVCEVDRGYKLRHNGLRGADIFLDEASVTATENALMAAALAPGRTVIMNAASEPHVQDLARFLVVLGARIDGIGTNVMTIDGVDRLGGGRFRVGPDHIEIASFIGLGAITGSDLTIPDVRPDDLRMINLTFARLGIRVEIEGDVLRVPPDQDLRVVSDEGGAIPKVDDGIWPAFPADLTSIATAVATQTHGTVMIFEKMFENRLFFVDKLVAMGARIILCDPHRAVISGPAQLYGERLESPDIRAGMAMLIASLAAKGTSTIGNAGQIDRGYERIDERLRAVGADIERVSE